MDIKKIGVIYSVVNFFYDQSKKKGFSILNVKTVFKEIQASTNETLKRL